MKRRRRYIEVSCEGKPRIGDEIRLHLLYRTKRCWLRRPYGWWDVKVLREVNLLDGSYWFFCKVVSTNTRWKLPLYIKLFFDFSERKFDVNVIQREEYHLYGIPQQTMSLVKDEEDFLAFPWTKMPEPKGGTP
jgi:hypothetical protein